MKRCWLHIGMPKTGSTSIQVYLDNQTKGKGWKYISLGGAASTNREMHAMFGTRPEQWYWFAKRGESREKIAARGQKMRQRLAKAIEGTRKENIILSSESLSMIEKRGIEALHEFLKPMFDEIRVVGYVRPPMGFMTSFFQQRVKAGHGEFSFKSTLPCYKKRFKKFDMVFGKENVILRRFDPASFPGGCIVADFCGLIGIDPPAEGEVKRVNESLSREACGILYAYHKFGPGYGVGKDVIKENNRIIAPLLAMGGKKFKLAKSAIHQHVDEADLRWMERRLGGKLREGKAEDGTEVTGEEDLLNVSRASCVEFARKFEEAYGVAVPEQKIPKSDPADPREVVALVDHCRLVGRKLLKAERRGRTGIPMLGFLIEKAKSLVAGGAKVSAADGGK